MNTGVGERGSAISGGQKTRLILARCIYHQPEIFLLDDPFSALDMHVADKILEKAVLNGLKNTTRIITTNAIHFLHNADHVIVLNNGEVVF